jgi:hypothetical protein
VTFHRRLRHSCAVFLLGNIRRDRAGAEANLGSRGLGLYEIPRGQQNLGAFAREDARNSLTDAFARASHDDRTARYGCQHNQTILTGSSGRSARAPLHLTRFATTPAGENQPDFGAALRPNIQTGAQLIG